METDLLPLRRAAGRLRRFGTAVSVHSHTLHSRESLDFLVGVLGRLPWLRQLAGCQCGTDQLSTFDFSRLYWTPPLSAAQALALERSQIEQALGLRALVALSDHDSIDGAMNLQVLRDRDAPPISVEWTVPFGGTFFHFGVYNLPVRHAREAMARMAAFTAAPGEQELRRLFAELDGFRQVLVVWNHPIWDEKGIGRPGHDRHLRALLELCRPWIHAIEFNGFRPAWENRRACELARTAGLPVVGGGDRHGRQANAVLNLTEAACFEEWIEQVRYRRLNHVLLMPELEECRRTRLAQSICDILRDDPAHALGWRRWQDRVFYRSEEGDAVPLSAVWRRHSPPLAALGFVRLMQLVNAALGHPGGRAAVRLALNLVGNQEAS